MGLLFISAPSALSFTRASSPVHLFRFSPHCRPYGGVSFAFASEPEPISDHLQMSRRCSAGWGSRTENEPLAGLTLISEFGDLPEYPLNLALIRRLPLSTHPPVRIPLA
ncbi:hypothetical protein TIFTF001_043010 [Ficus carica]|uniref:Uncharacterized protein n=1 Tax=Ficus carica TaxID=3494 RepID=A0AA87YPQ8_FICCA|nr:hypothetical protein TIFTF001_043010 [Ficus carica]